MASHYHSNVSHSSHSFESATSARRRWQAAVQDAQQVDVERREWEAVQL
jgi:ribosomal protein L28